MPETAPDQTLILITNAVGDAVYYGLIIAFVAAMMAWASRMAERKHRSRLWRIAVFLFTPLVLLLWMLPDRRRV